MCSRTGAQQCRAVQMCRRLAGMILMVVLIAAALSFNLPSKSYAAIEPTLTAKSAIVYCENTGEIVFTKDEEAKCHPYSITKIMTALVTVMNTPLDRKVKVSGRAATQPDSSAGLKTGEEVTIEQLLYAALVQSGNDAAYALAEATSGSADKFVKQMNRTAKNIGCENTHFASPSGLKNSNNYTTCSDMLKIVKVAFDNETIRTIAGTKDYLMKPTNKSGVRAFKSGAFGLDESVYAGKNGFWDGDCTTALACEKNGLNLYVIVMGDTETGRKADVQALVKYSDEKIEGVLAVKGGEKVGTIRIKRGAITKLDVYTETDGYAYIPSEGSKSLIKTEMSLEKDVTAPVKSGDKVGTYKIMVGSELVNEVPLIVKKNVPEGWPTSYLGISNRTALIMGIVLAAVLVLMIIILIIRIIIKIKRRKERKKRIMEIARKEMENEEDRRRRGWDV